MLVGGADNRRAGPDILLLLEFGDYNLKERFAPVWKRGPKGGFATGSLGAFVVIELRASAEKRGAKCLGLLVTVLSDRSSRKPGDVDAALTRMWDKLAVPSDGTAILSGASGAEPATGEERTFLGRHPELAVRATGSYVGHATEPQFVMNIALAAVTLSHGTLYPPGDDSRGTADAKPARTAGRDRNWPLAGRGMALVQAP